MYYTLNKAAEVLKESTNAYGQNDLRLLVNRAIQTLAGMKGWECLRKVLRFPCIGPRFVLPQGCAGLVRMCVNGRPATVRAQDFSFIHSGPGDMSRPPSGFVPVRAANVLDAGAEPVMFEPRFPCALGAWSPAGSGTDGTARLAVRAVAPDGRRVSLTLPVHMEPVWDESGGEDESATLFADDEAWSRKLVQCITEVVLELPADYGEYVTLYARDYSTREVYPLACYNPEIEVPSFRHYEISGVPPGMPLELLAEVRLDPLPLVKGTDLLPFSSVSPIEWVIRADWLMKSGEIATAQQYYAQAAQWLQSQETVDTTSQASLVVNSSFVNSPGEVSMEAVNI